LRPLALFEEFKSYTDNPDINPNYIKPKNFMLRMQKIMDEYSGGVTANFTTSKNYLEKGLELLTFLKEDAEKLAASGLHELMRLGERPENVASGGTHAVGPLPRGDQVARILFPVGLPCHGREELASFCQLPVGLEDRHMERDEEACAQFYLGEEVEVERHRV